MLDFCSFFSSLIAIWSTLFGVGMFFTPRAFAKSGVVKGIIQLAGVGLLSFSSIFVLFASAKILMDKSESSKKSAEGVLLDTHSIKVENDEDYSNSILQKMSYAFLGWSVCFPLGLIIDGMIIITGCFTVLFFQKYVSVITCNLLGYNLEEINGFRIYLICILFYGLIIWAGGQFKKLGDIDWLSKICMFCTGLNCMIVLVLSIVLSDYTKTHLNNPNQSWSLSVISTFIFAMDCQCNVVEIFTQSKNKNWLSLFLIAACAVVGTCFIYAIIGLSGRILFGDYMPDTDFINIFADKNSSITQYLFQQGSIYYYIPYLSPILAIIALLISSVFQLSAVTRSLNRKKIFKKVTNLTLRQAITTLIVILLGSIVNMFPQISLDCIFTIIGQFMSNFLGYLFPFILLIYFIWKKNWSVIILSSIISVISVVFGVYGFLEYIFQENPSEIDVPYYSTESIQNIIKQF